jgi:hypothetical protein
VVGSLPCNNPDKPDCCGTCINTNTDPQNCGDCGLPAKHGICCGGQDYDPSGPELCCDANAGDKRGGGLRCDKATEQCGDSECIPNTEGFWVGTVTFSMTRLAPEDAQHHKKTWSGRIVSDVAAGTGGLAVTTVSVEFHHTAWASQECCEVIDGTTVCRTERYDVVGGFTRSDLPLGGSFNVGPLTATPTVYFLELSGIPLVPYTLEYSGSDCGGPLKVPPQGTDEFAIPWSSVILGEQQVVNGQAVFQGSATYPGDDICCLDNPLRDSATVQWDLVRKVAQS